jgi:hypothetical protein
MAISKYGHWRGGASQDWQAPKIIYYNRRIQNNDIFTIWIAHIWKSPSPKSLFIDKYENDTHAPVYYQYDTYHHHVAEFHKKGKCTHRQLQTNDAERSTLVYINNDNLLKHMYTEKRGSYTIPTEQIDTACKSNISIFKKKITKMLVLTW